jgi:hypothetical protein
MLLVATGLVIAVAAILALGVIPPLRAAAALHGLPDMVTPFLGPFVIANVLVAAALLGAMGVTRQGGCASKVLLGAAGLVALAAGFVLLMPALEFYFYDNSRDAWTFLLFACAGGDLAAALLAFAGVVVRLRRPPSE